MRGGRGKHKTYGEVMVDYEDFVFIIISELFANWN
jgi:hypothetical protein